MTHGQVAIEAMDLLCRSSARVPGSRIREWLATRDPDVLSVVYEAVTRAGDRIDGGVSPEVYFELVTASFSAVLEKRGQSEYALSPYDAATIYGAFLLRCAKDSAVHPELLRLLRMGAWPYYKCPIF